jgi:hypothetical protein
VTRDAIFTYGAACAAGGFVIGYLWREALERMQKK